MAIPGWITGALEASGASFEVLHHRAAFSAQEVAQSEHMSGHKVAKVVIVFADSRCVELILPASRRVALNRVARLLGATDVRLASEDELNKVFTGSEPGAIPALRHGNDVVVLLDSSLANCDSILFQAGTHEDAIRMKFEVWLRLVEPLVGSFTHLDIGRTQDSFSEHGTTALAEELPRGTGLPGGGKNCIEVVRQQHRRESLKAREVMSQPVVTVSPDSSLADVARAMVDRSVGCVLVVDRHSKLCGIITQSDFGDKEHGFHYSPELLLHSFTHPTDAELAKQAKIEAQGTRAGEVMQTEVVSVGEETPLEEVACLMLRYDIDHIPVLRAEIAVGMLARHDFLRLVATDADGDDRAKSQLHAAFSTASG